MTNPTSGPNQFNLAARQAIEERRKRNAIGRLKEAVRAAIRDYDASRDHARHDPITEPDCIRCRLATIVGEGQ